MNQRAVAMIGRLDAHKLQQFVKWTVYALLLVNFVLYIFEDANRAMHSIHSGSMLLDLTSEFATTIDEAAWFFLLVMFELETYVLDDEKWKGWVAIAIHGLRLVCFVMIAHTIFAFAIYMADIRPTKPVENVSHLCDMTENDVSFVYNLEYTEIGAESCQNLSADSEYFWLADDPLVTDTEGLRLERGLALADLLEVVAWIIIIIAMEVVVRLQDRDITGGRLISSMNTAKILMYLLLMGLGFYWVSLGHWLYFWDGLLWIGGFAAIEMNLSQWRDEILEQAEPGTVEN